MTTTIALEHAFLNERPRLVRWMTTLTANQQIAEDIVQETYLTAWQKRDNLTDLSGIDKWLNAIAYNIYKRWLRANGKQASHEMDLEDAPLDALAEYQLEHHELTDLLDKALALLSPENRAILIARYLEEQPQAKVARDLGMTENALAVRLHRGKMTLRKILDDELSSKGDDWQDTRLWCGMCGKTHYQAKFNSDTGELMLYCPNCNVGNDYPAWGGYGSTELIRGIKTIKPAFNRLRVENYERYCEAIQTDHVICEHCGHDADVILKMPDFVPLHESNPGMHFLCQKCGVIGYTALNGIAGSIPQAFVFEKDNPRIEAIPSQYLNHKGVEALHLHFKSIRNSNTLDVIFARANYQILSVYINGQEVTDER